MNDNLRRSINFFNAKSSLNNFQKNDLYITKALPYISRNSYMSLENIKQNNIPFYFSFKRDIPILGRSSNKPISQRLYAPSVEKFPSKCYDSLIDMIKQDYTCQESTSPIIKTSRSIMNYYSKEKKLLEGFKRAPKLKKLKIINSERQLEVKRDWLVNDKESRILQKANPLYYIKKRNLEIKDYITLKRKKDQLSLMISKSATKLKKLKY